MIQSIGIHNVSDTGHVHTVLLASLTLDLQWGGGGGGRMCQTTLYVAASQYSSKSYSTVSSYI